MTTGPTSQKHHGVCPDLWIFAPHPDDEVLGCGGLILQALEQKKRVRVVVMTNGGGFPRAAAIITGKPRIELSRNDYLKLAAERQRQSLQGIAILGLPKDDLMFLGFPDSGLATIYRSEDDQVYRQQFTGKDETFGITAKDYHSTTHGKPAQYTRRTFLGTLEGIIKTTGPKEIYVTNELDTHSDHKAAFWFVRDAARQAGFNGKLLTYIVHGKKIPQLPLRRVHLTAVQVQQKKAAIRPHQIPIVHDHLDSHAKEEERFWHTPLDPITHPHRE